MALAAALAGIGSKKGKKPTRTEIIRIDCGLLFTPTKDKYPEFHLPTLIKQQTGKIEENNPLEDNEEYRKLEAIAKKFDEKYGPKRDKKGKKYKFGKPEDYLDLGMGYDLEDPFIDDTEAYDELVPSTLTPMYGGFYVNRGPLEYREVSDSDDDESERPKKKIRRLPSSNEKTSSSSDDEPNLATKTSPATSPEKALHGPSSDTILARRLDSPLKRGRPKMTPEQKAAANIMKKAAGRKTKPITEAKRGTITGDKSENRISNVVNSVIFASAKDKLADNKAKSPNASVDDAVNAVLSGLETSRPSAKPLTVLPEGGDKNEIIFSSDSPKLASTSTIPKTSAVVQQQQNSIPSAKLGEPQVHKRKSIIPSSDGDADDVVIIMHDSPPERQARLLGKPPQRPASSKQETKETWHIPLQLKELNKTLVQVATETGQKRFNGRTDAIMHSVQQQCQKLGLRQHQVDAVIRDLSTRLNVNVDRVMARWYGIKSGRTNTYNSNSKGSQNASSGLPGQRTTSGSSSSSSPSKDPKPVDYSVYDLQTLYRLLQEEINRRMPELELEYRKIADETASKKLELIQTTSGLDQATKPPDQPSGSQNGDVDRPKNLYTPRRKFDWTDKSKRLFKAIADILIRRICGDASIVDKSDSYKEFLEKELVPLWPFGWMNARELIKETKVLQSPETYAKIAKEKVVTQQQSTIPKTIVEPAPAQQSSAMAIPKIMPEPATSKQFSTTAVPKISTEPAAVPKTIAAPVVGKQFSATSISNISTESTIAKQFTPTQVPKIVAEPASVKQVSAPPMAKFKTETSTAKHSSAPSISVVSPPKMASLPISSATSPPKGVSTAPRPVSSVARTHATSFSVPTAPNQVRTGFSQPSGIQNYGKPRLPTATVSTSASPQRLNLPTQNLSPRSFATANNAALMYSPRTQQQLMVEQQQELIRRALMYTLSGGQGNPRPPNANSWMNYHRGNN